MSQDADRNRHRSVRDQFGRRHPLLDRVLQHRRIVVRDQRHGRAELVVMEVRAEVPQGRRNGRRVLDEPSDDSEVGKAFLGAQQQAEVRTAVALTHSDQVAVQCIERDDRRRICEEIRVDAGRERHLGRIDSCLAQQARGRAHGNEHHEAVSRGGSRRAGAGSEARVAVRAAKGRWHQVVIICPETIKDRRRRELESPAADHASSRTDGDRP